MNYLWQEKHWMCTPIDWAHKWLAHFVIMPCRLISRSPAVQRKTLSPSSGLMVGSRRICIGLEAEGVGQRMGNEGEKQWHLPTSLHVAKTQIILTAVKISDLTLKQTCFPCHQLQVLMFIWWQLLNHWRQVCKML